MAMKIRLARGGSKKRPHYSIVATDSRMPRDGRFIEKLGIYNPLLPKDSEERVKMDLERIQHWLAQGAQPMPWAQPLTNHKTNIAQRADAKQGKTKFTAPERISPVAMKYLGLERSETLPIRNLLRP